MGAGVLLKELINCYSIDSTFFMARNIDIGDMMVSQEGCEVLGIPDIVTIGINMLH